MELEERVAQITPPVLEGKEADAFLDKMFGEKIPLPKGG